MKLSDEQLKIVNAPIGGAIQVLAAAGSGKTRVLTERIRFLLASSRKDGVIALTFTNKAAEEMQARLDEVPDLSERVIIGTIHSFAQRVISQYGHTIGLPDDLTIFEREQDLKAIFVEALRTRGERVDSLLGEDEDPSEKAADKIISNYFHAFSEFKRELMSEQEVRERYPQNEYLWPRFEAYQETLLRSGGIDFEDILVYARKILVDQDWCAEIYRGKYRHLCVDEAQDLNRVQYEFIKAICGAKLTSLLMVGDPNQMIYGFNGSSHTFLSEHFIKEFSPLTFSLKDNFRSSRAVIALANKLKPGSQRVTDYALSGTSEFQSFENDSEEAIWVHSKIVELISRGTDPDIEGPITLNNVVVLARNRFVFAELERTLKVNALPYSLKKGERLAEANSVFGKVLDLTLRLKVNPRDWVDGKKLCAVLRIQPPPTWEGLNVIEFFLSMPIDHQVAHAGFQAKVLVAVFALDSEQPKIPKFCAQIRDELLKLKPDGSQTSARELEQSLLELDDFRRSWDLFRSKGLGSSLVSFRNAMALGQLYDDVSTDGLTLSTVHTMKGLEKDIVFLIGLCEGVFPDYRARTSKELSEELNNAFVAVTRAKRWIFVSYPASRMMPWGEPRGQTPSRYWSLMTE